MNPLLTILAAILLLVTVRLVPSPLSGVPGAFEAVALLILLIPNCLNVALSRLHYHSR